MKMNANRFDLSIIIVNYNVEFFLEQCLNSVEKSRQNLNIEVFVVNLDVFSIAIECFAFNEPASG